MDQIDMFSSLLDVEDDFNQPPQDIEVKPISKEVSEIVKKAKLLNQRNYVLTDLNISNNLEVKAADNIEAIKTLQSIDGLATDSEKDKLIKYTGWGGLPHVFDDSETCKLPLQRDELKSILDEEDYEQARASVLNAHFTPLNVVKFMWDAVCKLGFKNGKILDPSTGIGNFIGAMPKSVSEKSQIHAVEIDSLSSDIAGKLYPDTFLNKTGYESVNYINSTFDLIVSNVPFGDYRVSDEAYDHLKLNIHNYFFAKSLDLVKPGGVIAFITSRYLMDGQSTSFREYLSDRADLLGAFRLPSSTFKKIANTEVVSDIIFLRKRHLDEEIRDPDTVNWIGVEYISQVAVNSYFVKNKEHILGDISFDGDGYFNKKMNVTLKADSLDDKLATALTHLESNVVNISNDKDLQQTIEPTIIPAPDHVKEGAFTLVGDVLMKNEKGSLSHVEQSLNATAVKRIKGLIRIRNVVRELIAKDMVGESSSKLREKLNIVYDKFVKKHGYIWSRGNRSAFQDDPDYPLLLSLEKYDEETEKASKADIFTKVTIRQSSLNEDFDNLEQGILVSLNKSAVIDVDYIAHKLDVATETIEKELAESDYVFLDPETNNYVMKDEYLSGNVREKLNQTKRAINVDTSFNKNVEALNAVLPDDVVAEDIHAKLGVSWINRKHIVNFVAYLLEVSKVKDIKVYHEPKIATWTVATYDAWINSSALNISEYGTDALPALKLIELALNQKSVKVYKTIITDGEAKRVVDAEETEVAKDKLNKINEQFAKWLWSDSERKSELVTLYNKLFNSFVERDYDGSHLQMPNMNNAIELRGHQKNAIWRGVISQDNLLLAHAVGAGKTMTYCGIAMESKRLGISHKPMIVIPNHMLDQFSSEFMAMYPAANILVVGKKDLVGQKRKIMTSRIATGNWDSVIMTHSSFGKIALSNEYVIQYSKEITNELSLIIKDKSSSHSSTGIVKKIEMMKKRVSTRIDSMISDKDEGLKFDELGVDQLLVDEAHLFKNLMYFSQMERIAGLPQTSSKRAFDLLLKIKSVMNNRNDNRGIIFGTATPIANSVAEMFIMQTFLQGDNLVDLNIDMFDAWAANFGEVVTSIEVAPDGSGYRMNNRFAKFKNVPELMSIFRQVADIQTKEMLKLPTPELENGKHIVVSSKPSPELKDYVQDLVNRADKIRAGSVNSHQDNMLKITNEGRLAALDMRLIDPSIKVSKESKVNKCIDNVLNEWRLGKESKTTQLVFCDLSTPSKDKFSVYNEIKSSLINKGIPEEEVAFIHDYNSDSQKAKLFKAVRSGTIRVLLGSTSKMGFGTNVQDLLVAAHHIDAPWRPADVEQRDGRIIRQGNTNDIVRVYRYVTEESFDAYMWQTLETKVKFINQVMTGKVEGRTIEDVDSSALSYAEVKAIASGNPLIVEKAGVDAEVTKLQMLKRNYLKSQRSLKYDLDRNLTDQDRVSKRIDRVKKDLSTHQPISDFNDVKLEIGGKYYVDVKSASEALLKRVGKIKKAKQKAAEIATINGFTVNTALTMGINGYSYEFFLANHDEYLIILSRSKEDAINSVINAYNNIGLRLDACMNSIAELKKDNENIVKSLAAPFEYELRLENRLSRQREIDTEIGIYDDLDGSVGIESDLKAA